MSLYAIGDTHLSFGTDKPMDIFRGWQNFEERLEKNWNSLVTENDTVVVAGDISWAMNIEGAKEDFRFLDKLNGCAIGSLGDGTALGTGNREINGFSGNSQNFGKSRDPETGNQNRFPQSCEEAGSKRRKKDIK